MDDRAVIAAGMEAQLAEWRRRIAGGERRLGWKIGLNLPAVQRRLGISAPVIGFLTSAGELAAAGRHSLAGGTRVGVEPEIAVTIGADLAAGRDESAARAAVEALGPAIEVVDIDAGFDDLTKILAANVFHRGVVLGPRRADLPAASDELYVSVRRGGREATAHNDPGALASVPTIVNHVAGMLDTFGERLLAGDVVICGSLTDIVWVEPGDVVEVALDPLGRVGVGFTA